jgi:hypothetical protein
VRIVLVRSHLKAATSRLDVFRLHRVLPAQLTAIIDLHIDRMVLDLRKHGCKVPLKRLGPRRYTLLGVGQLDLNMADGRVTGVVSGQAKSVDVLEFLMMTCAGSALSDLSS